MRVAIVAEVYLPKIDGVVIRTMNLIRQLQNAGDEVVVICPEATRPRDSPVPCIEFPGFAFPMYPEYRIGLPNDKLVEELQQFRPDVVHFLNPFGFGFRCYDILQKAEFSLPIVFSFHTLYAEFVKRYGALRPLSRMLWWLTKHYHNKADVNLTVSAAMVEELKSLGFERVEEWQPAVDSDLFSPTRRCADMRQRLKGDYSKSRQLLTVSRLAPEKNVEFLAEVLRKVPDASLAIVGDGPHRANLERHFAGLPVTFLGYMKDEELATAYASADAFVYASETETMGNVILEAMAAGSAIVAPRAGGIPSLVEHNESGLLFEPRETEAAAAFVNKLLDSPARRKQISTNARHFGQTHGWKEAAQRVRRDYEHAIERHRNSRRAMLPTSLTAKFTTETLVRMFQLASAFSTPKGSPGLPETPHATATVPAKAIGA